MESVPEEPMTAAPETAVGKNNNIQAHASTTVKDMSLQFIPENVEMPGPITFKKELIPADKVDQFNENLLTSTTEPPITPDIETHACAVQSKEKIERPIADLIPIREILTHVSNSVDNNKENELQNDLQSDDIKYLQSVIHLYFPQPCVFVSVHIFRKRTFLLEMFY